MSHNRASCTTIAQAMQDNGFLKSVLAGGPELDRVKQYLLSFAHPERAPEAARWQAPDYPLFPGLRHRPFHERAELPAVVRLEAAAGSILQEWRALGDQAHMRYAPPAMQALWQVRLLHYMGVDLGSITGNFEVTRALLKELPGLCLDYPWADALFSCHSGRSHLAPHCSVDNLRLRCHLALQVPLGCRIRVADETRQWTNGQALLFEDSFEHEVWNDSEEPRVILIVDFWHPDLTAVERAALTAGFGHSSVRQLFMWQRLQAADSIPVNLQQHLREQMRLQDALPERLHFWTNLSVADSSSTVADSTP
jgi:aspartate beta-hydroxylase